ncbi:hypothetical protein B4092_4836 [Bacillus licheniformis]|uniref:hypothetical protein n=1 Tax=Bacillus licheniformis TaxID=1402 RepID=UPI000779ED7D|nr:hypothetical protein [Bacillus licheniformis]KYC77099.1 hypothetical protein B4092_4836 [Bacillus licheniformis]TWM14791.1 hypothetical protein CHCC15091_1832 [Bacillus licheniformis]TWN76553.1 hypothetical protein CHCC20494_0616 [Bacillus licheniformis]
MRHKDISFALAVLEKEAEERIDALFNKEWEKPYEDGAVTDIRMIKSAIKKIKDVFKDEIVEGE